MDAVTGETGPNMLGMFGNISVSTVQAGDRKTYVLADESLSGELRRILAFDQYRTIGSDGIRRFCAFALAMALREHPGLLNASVSWRDLELYYLVVFGNARILVEHHPAEILAVMEGFGVCGGEMYRDLAAFRHQLLFDAELIAEFTLSTLVQPESPPE